MTNTSVFCGLYFTFTPRLVTCTIDDLSVSRVSLREFAIGCPSRTPAHTIPLPDALRARDKSTPADSIASVLVRSVR